MTLHGVNPEDTNLNLICGMESAVAVSVILFSTLKELKKIVNWHVCRKWFSPHTGSTP
jgi:hypothetical protein